MYGSVSVWMMRVDCLGKEGKAGRSLELHFITGGVLEDTIATSLFCCFRL